MECHLDCNLSNNTTPAVHIWNSIHLYIKFKCEDIFGLFVMKGVDCQEKLHICSKQHDGNLPSLRSTQKSFSSVLPHICCIASISNEKKIARFRFYNQA